MNGKRPPTPALAEEVRHAATTASVAANEASRLARMHTDYLAANLRALRWLTVSTLVAMAAVVVALAITAALIIAGR